MALSSTPKNIQEAWGITFAWMMFCSLFPSVCFSDKREYVTKLHTPTSIINEPVHEISNNVVCATSKASDQPAHMRSLIRAFASRLNIL